MSARLADSIPANNVKIIELYNKLRSKSLDVRPDFQRKLVWKKIHKFKFIETILLNYPFPEIYIAPGELDSESITLTEKVVDGQQRLSAIKDYIEGTDVFAESKITIKKFNELSAIEKAAFLNYEVSVRYLKNSSEEQTKEIFQRINKTDYALNKIERFNAQWGDSEFVCFAKQLLDKDYDNSETTYKLSPDNIDEIQKFFFGKEPIFSDSNTSRMTDLQYFLVILATIVGEEYFQRNNNVEELVEAFNDNFSQAEEIEPQLTAVVRFIRELDLPKSTTWLNKTNLFTLIIELYKYDLDQIDSNALREELLSVDHKYRYFLLDEGDKVALTAAGKGLVIDSETSLFFQNSRVAVNDKGPRVQRANFVEKLIETAFIK
ncbi:DUF262 domain-containing protein [Pseudomonas atacamensis]|jgi:hypothetical protein|uniref:DUF262 domain-containing protein n=1 Tax=Pseudomonas atacamensis TaxID=2565368 RepID=UPI002449A756|nr:DUF262 domain-containing protein [Pseudomonas atacamensis]MDH2079128.1 DUF262 domain-containing protein [Pseudomonas atacamensis]